MESNEKEADKLVKQLLGLSYWRRHWAIPAGIIIAPIALTTGLVAGEYYLGFFDKSQVPTVGQAIVGFSAFLTAAWTFGFAYFWPSTERTAREVRRLFLAGERASRQTNLLETLAGLRMPFWTFLFAITAFALMVWSALLSVSAILMGSGFFIVLSITSLTAACILMIGVWFQLYVVREALSNIVELALDSRAEKKGS